MSSAIRRLLSTRDHHHKKSTVKFGALCAPRAPSSIVRAPQTKCDWSEIVPLIFALTSSDGHCGANVTVAEHAFGVAFERSGEWDEIQRVRRDYYNVRSLLTLPHHSFPLECTDDLVSVRCPVEGCSSLLRTNGTACNRIRSASPRAVLREHDSQWETLSHLSSPPRTRGSHLRGVGADNGGPTQSLRSTSSSRLQSRCRRYRRPLVARASKCGLPVLAGGCAPLALAVEGHRPRKTMPSQ